jgi:hypothetical protein
VILDRGASGGELHSASLIFDTVWCIALISYRLVTPTIGQNFLLVVPAFHRVQAPLSSQNHIGHDFALLPFGPLQPGVLSR